MSNLSSQRQKEQQQENKITYTLFLLPFLFLLLVPAYHYLYSSPPDIKAPLPDIMATKQSNRNLNVFKKPLALFSQSPMTGFYRDGYCRVGAEDGGNHAVAGLLTKEFLDFSASRGNNLRSVGLEPGCKWCLCTARWKEAMQAARDEKDPVVPKVFLHATDESALSNGVSMADLKRFAAEPEVPGGGGSLEKQAPIQPGQKGGVAKEQH